MAVYIEYAVIDNLVLDYLLLKGAMKTARIKFTEFQLIAAAILGTLFALFFPLMNVGGLVAFLLKMIVGEIITLVAGRYNDIYGFVRAFLYFLLYTFAAGGAMIGVCFLLGLKFDSDAGFSILSAAGDVAFGFIILSGYLFAKLVGVLFGNARKTADIGGFLREVSVFDGSGSVRLDGMIDTGNTLYDGKTGKPVSVISKEVADRLILGGTFRMKGAHYISYGTLKGKGRILVFEIERMVIYCGEDRNIIDNAMIGVSPDNAAMRCDVILHSGLLTGGV
ncbi:MAG: sigma-E processing peptidase SpoIIGA [Clostridia bacterium]|nr:sigma-E processing peptidase SpoIIGA [Clostridia bacterium]